MTWMHPLPTDCRFPGYALSPPCKIRFTKQLLYVMIILSRISGEEYRQYTMKYEEYPTKHPAPESQTLGRKPLPSNVILGETAYSPGDHAVTLWPFYDPVFPVNVMAIGETKCRPDYHVIRPRSRIMAIEYIAQVAGILKINGQTYRPEQNCTILLTKHSAHSYEADAQNPWQKHWIGSSDESRGHAARSLSSGKNPSGHRRSDRREAVTGNDLRGIQLFQKSYYYAIPQ